VGDEIKCGVDHKTTQSYQWKQAQENPGGGGKTLSTLESGKQGEIMPENCCCAANHLPLNRQFYELG
jgi:hypothetical protein